MAENIGPRDESLPPFSEITSGDKVVIHYMDMPNIPEGTKRDACLEHLDAGVASELMGEFQTVGCHFPEPSEEQVIRTAFICPGPSIFKKCRLRLVQADAEGNVITQMVNKHS